MTTPRPTPMPMSRLLSRALIAITAAAVLATLAPSAQAVYEGLVNGQVEGPAGPDYGFELGIVPSIDDWTTTVGHQTQATLGPACNTGSGPAPDDGQVHGDSCAVDLGVPGPTTSWSAVESIKLWPSALGGKLADMQSFSAWHNVPTGPGAQENAGYQFFYRIDINEDSQPDACIVQAEGFPLIPSWPANTGGWQQIVFSSTDPSIKFHDTDAQCSTCVPPCNALLQSDVQNKYPTARILNLYIQVFHRDWDAAPDYPDWPSGVHIYLDDFSLLMQNSDGVLLQGAATLTVTEGGPDDGYGIRLSGSPAPGEIVTVTISEDPGSGSSQLSISPTSVQFDDGNWQTAQPITVQAIDDTIAEADPITTTIRHTVSSTSLTSQYSSMTVPSTSVTVHDDDVSGVSADPDSVDLSEATPATTATFDVKLGSTPAPGETVTVTLSPDGQETVDTDPVMVGDQNVLTFDNLGPLSKPVVVTVVDDSVDEANPSTAHVSGTVSSNLPSSAYTGATFSDVDVVIKDNDPVVTVAGTTDADENGPVSGVFTFTRGPDLTYDVDVDYTIDGGTASAGSDFTMPYAGTSGTLTIPAGSASATLSVAALDDADDESTETIVLVLTDTSEPYTAGPTASASVDLLDDDDPTVSVANTADAAEAGLVDGVFTLTRSNADLALDVDYALSGAATGGGVDYTSLASPVHFNAGEATVQVKATPVDDLLDESSETVMLTLTAGTGYTVAAAPDDAATVSIVDDDLPTVSIAALVAAASETGPTDGTVRISRTGGDTSAAQVVTFVVSGTATPGTDYASLGTSATILAGNTFVDVTIAPIDDSTVETDESVTVTLQTDAAFFLAASPDDAATVTIADDDYSVTLDATTASASEVGPVSGVFTLTRDKIGPALVVTVTFTGTATGGTDYPSPPATITIPVGQTSTTYTIVPAVDLADEAAETVIATASAGTSYVVGSPGAGTVTIADGNAPVASPDSVAAYKNCPKTVPASGVLGNDAMPTGMSYTANAFAGATGQGGSVNLLSSGAFTYTPPNGFTGTDTFTYRDNDGTYDSAPVAVTLTVGANTPPVAHFQANPQTAAVGEPVLLHDTSTDAEGGMTAWLWDFGDASGGAGPIIVHTFHSVGSFPVRLSVQDDQCGWASVVQQVTVVAGQQPQPLPPPTPPPPPPPAPTDPPVEQPLVADAGPAQTVDAGASVTLSASSPTAGVTFRWTQFFGPTVNLAGSDKAKPSFTAPAPDGNDAEYLYFTLVVSKDGKDSEAAMARVTVLSANHDPTAKASGGEAIPGTVVTLDARGSGDADGDAITYRWTQWRGPPVALEAATSDKPTFVMPDAPPGAELEFALEVSDGRASTVAVTKVVALAGAAPAPAFTVAVLVDGTVTLTPTAAGASYEWDFGDGSPHVVLDSAKPVVHRYAPGARYTADLAVTGEDATQHVQRSFDVGDTSRSRPVEATAGSSWPAGTTLAVAAIVGAVLVALILLVLLRGKRTQPR
ncbi:MAG: Calx-beta domain-containing protein [bacterium]